LEIRITKKKKTFVPSSRLTIQFVRKALTSLRGGGLRLYIGLPDLHDVEDATVHGDHGGQQRHNLQLVQDDCLEGVLGHCDHNEDYKQDEDHESLQKDSKLHKERLDQDEYNLSEHDDNLPVVEFKGVAPKEEA
jgi:hypothetical protein